METFTRSVMELQRQSGETAPSEDTLRKQLQKTLEEYENILYMGDEQVRKISEGDQGCLIDGCLACSGMTEQAGALIGSSQAINTK